MVRRLSERLHAALETRTATAPVLGWETSSRDEGKVARELYETRTLDRVHSLSEAAFFDELFHSIREIGAWPLLEGLDPDDRQRPLHPFIRFVMFTIMRCVGGVQSMLATQDVLLTDESLMSLLGFNATQVREGSTARGLDRQKEPVEIRGPFSYETVADNIVRIGPEKLAEMFNGVIRCLAAQGFFPKKIDAVLDATDDEATSGYAMDTKGAPVPSVAREKRPDVRANRHATKVKVTVFGWKVWLVWEPVSKIPLALKLDGIQEPDNKHAYEVLAQARTNVQGHATLRSVALDRGFLDGKLLSRLDDDDLIVYIPAKKNMAVAQNAREIARRAVAEAAQGKTLPGCVVKERAQTVTRGAGKNAVSETRTTTLVGISELPCDWWTHEGSSSAANAKDFEAKKLHATVVMRWDGAPKEAEKEVVLLTTHPSHDPFVAFDAYDDRSLIENTCNREAKEHWFLEHHPKRSEAGVRVHAYFVFVCMALVAAFRLYKEKTDEAERRGKETGITRYRRQLEVQNRDKVAVFIGQHFGIFRNFEFALLSGLTVRELAVAGESAKTVLQRYGAYPAPS